jgi:WD40 repeat protein
MALQSKSRLPLRLVVVLCALVIAALACSVDMGNSGGTSDGNGSGGTSDGSSDGGSKTEPPTETGGGSDTSGGSDTGGSSTTSGGLSAGAITLDNANKVDVSNTFTYQGEQSALTSVAFNPADSNLVAGYGLTKIVVIWDITTGKPVAELPGPSEYGEGLAFSPDGTLLAAAGYDYRARVWKVSDKSLLTTIQTNVSATRVVFNSDGTQIAVAGWDNSRVLIYDATSGAKSAEIKPTGVVLWAVAYSADGKYLAAADDHGNINVFDPSNNSNIATLSPTFVDQVSDLEFSPDGTMLAVGYDEGDVAIFSTEDWKRITTFKNLAPTNQAALHGIAWTADSKAVVAGGAEGRLVISDARNGGTLLDKLLSAPIWGVSVAGDGTAIAAAMDNGDLVVLKLK